MVGGFIGAGAAEGAGSEGAHHARTDAIMERPHSSSRACDSTLARSSRANSIRPSFQSASSAFTPAYG
jgi:hypothetical protein